MQSERAQRSLQPSHTVVRAWGSFPFPMGKCSAPTKNLSAAAHIPSAAAPALPASAPRCLSCSACSFFLIFYFFFSLTERSFSISAPPELENKPGQKLTLFQKYPAKPHSQKSPPFLPTSSINIYSFLFKLKKKKKGRKKAVPGMGPCSHVSPRGAVSAGHGGGGSSRRAPAPRSRSRGSVGMEPPRSPAVLALPCPSIASACAGGASTAPAAAPRRGRRGGEGEAARGERAGAAGGAGGGRVTWHLRVGGFTG